MAYIFSVSASSPAGAPLAPTQQQATPSSTLYLPSWDFKQNESRISSRARASLSKINCATLDRVTQPDQVHTPSNPPNNTSNYCLEVLQRYVDAVSLMYTTTHGLCDSFPGAIFTKPSVGPPPPPPIAPHLHNSGSRLTVLHNLVMPSSVSQSLRHKFSRVSAVFTLSLFSSFPVQVQSNCPHIAERQTDRQTLYGKQFSTQCPSRFIVKTVRVSPQHRVA